MKSSRNGRPGDDQAAEQALRIVGRDLCSRHKMGANIRLQRRRVTDCRCVGGSSRAGFDCSAESRTSGRAIRSPVKRIGTATKSAARRPPSRRCMMHSIHRLRRNAWQRVENHRCRSGARARRAAAHATIARAICSMRCVDRDVHAASRRSRPNVRRAGRTESRREVARTHGSALERISKFRPHQASRRSSAGRVDEQQPAAKPKSPATITSSMRLLREEVFVGCAEHLVHFADLNSDVAASTISAARRWPSMSTRRFWTLST